MWQTVHHLNISAFTVRQNWIGSLHVTFLAHLNNLLTYVTDDNVLWFPIKHLFCERTIYLCEYVFKISRNDLWNERFEYFVGCNVILCQWYERNYLKALVILPGLQQLMYSSKEYWPMGRKLALFPPAWEHFDAHTLSSNTNVSTFYTKKFTIFDW